MNRETPSLELCIFRLPGLASPRSFQPHLTRARAALTLPILFAISACTSLPTGDGTSTYSKLVMDQKTDSYLYNVSLKQDDSGLQLQGNVGTESRSRGPTGGNRHIDVFMTRKGEVETINGIVLLPRKRKRFFYRIDTSPNELSFLRLQYSPFPHHRHEDNWLHSATN